MPIETGKTSQHHNWPRYMDWPQIGLKIAIKQGKERQKDKWCPFRAPPHPQPPLRTRKKLPDLPLIKSAFAGEHPTGSDHNQDFPKSTVIQMGGVLQYKWDAYWQHKREEHWQYLRVCWPARGPRAGKSPKVLPECSRECSQKSGCSRECSRECSRGSSHCTEQQEAPSRALSGALPRAPRFLRAHSREHSGSTFGDFPALDSLAGQQTSKTILPNTHLRRSGGWGFWHSPDLHHSAAKFLLQNVNWKTSSLPLWKRKTATPPEDIRTKSLRLCSFSSFLAWAL